MTTFPWTSETKKTMNGVSVASSLSMALDDLNSRYTCIQEPLPAADASTSVNNRRFPTSLRVYGSREVDEPQSPPLAGLSNPAVDHDIIDPQRIIEKMTAVLKALSLREARVLVQFWSPVAVKKRLLLTTLDQPFGLGMIDEGLYMHRLKSEQRMFVVDEEHIEELDPPELGSPSRVYRQKLPEWSLDINDISDWAASNNIHGYLNLPVFEPSSGVCVGVLELIITSSNYVDYAFEVQQVSRALMEENLKSPNVLEDTNFYTRAGDEKRQLELVEIFQALKMVCDTHNIPLAQTWGPCGYSSVVASSGNLMMSCSSFSKNCIGKVCMSTAALPFYVPDLSKWEFREACRARHLDKSQGVVGSSLSSGGLCFCEDVSQLGEEEYPLGPYARMHGITSCLAIYLKSIELDDEYVVELFLPTHNENKANLQSLVKTVKQLIKNASRVQLGDMLSIQDIRGFPLDYTLEFSTLTEDLHPLTEDEKNSLDRDVVFSKEHGEFAYVQHMEEENRSNSAAAGKRLEKYIDYSEEPVRKRSRACESISQEEIMKHYGKTLEEAAKSLGVRRSTLESICRRHGILRWPYNSTFNSTDPMDLHLSDLEMVMSESDTSETEYANVADQWRLPNESMEKISDNFCVEKINLLKEDSVANRDSDTVVSTNTVTKNVRFKDSIVPFTFLLSDRLLIWEREVANKFKIEGRKAHLKYKDEDGDWILICVDDDLKFALESGTDLICEPDDVHKSAGA